jgi:hypothetical protein
MNGMPQMLPYTIQGSMNATTPPKITIGMGPNKQGLTPKSPQDDSYWIVILDATNPANRVQEFVVPASNNSAVPNGLDQYMTSPAYLFAVVTQHLSTNHVPQGSFYDYLAKYGAGRELQRLEQISTSLGCGVISYMSYALTGHCGQQNGGAYEVASTSGGVLLLKSLMPMPNGQPPYTICDSYTFYHG